MSWGKLDDKAYANPKLRAVGKAVRGAIQMVWGFCSLAGTDGWVPDWVIENEFTKAELKIATTEKANGRAPLLHRFGDECSCLHAVAAEKWTAELGGLWVHDWLPHNPSKAENTVHKAKGRELQDKDLRYLIQRRDGNSCRYCGVIVPWQDKKSPRALTIDHVNPTLAAGAANLVIACTTCNSSKKDAITPEAAGLTLLPPPVDGTVPRDGWLKGTDPAVVVREWPPEPPAPIALETTDGSPDPITDRPPIANRSDHRSDPDPATDPDPADNPGPNPAQTTDDQVKRTADAPAGTTDHRLPLGRGRDGSGSRSSPVRSAGDVGPEGRRPTIGPATTPRSAADPPTYRKSATSNPPPAADLPPPPGGVP
ncbi:HNH endonuclease [Amycolatopsis sp. cmx-4-68]|uniref:HNH endonuclease n=1 Tax=Amycolatopsis sp. cmx-4-68 TaxID=2790938 RepID=UPI00397AAE09